MTVYYRPLLQRDLSRPKGAAMLGQSGLWFTHAQAITRQRSEHVSVADIPGDVLARICAPRAAVCGLTVDQPLIMGILNVTPDSFSDGGLHNRPDQALAHARQMILDGADIIDIGGESTRPGALAVPAEAETTRTAPVIAALRRSLQTPISIDTRKASVARAAHQAGANMVNDVSGFTYDPALARYCAKQGLPVCVMHAQGDPQTMQANPQYDNVLLDVYDFLAGQIAHLESLGIARQGVIVDPGIGFGKTLAHNLALLNGLALFHGLGCPILLGASRKKFIATLSPAEAAADRMAGSLAVALAAVAQGVHILRVHDVNETRAALNLWQAVAGGKA